MPRTKQTPAQAAAVQDAAKKAAKKAHPVDDNTPVFEEVQETIRFSGCYGAFLSELDDEYDEPDVELEAETLSEAVTELLEHYGRDPASPGEVRLEMRHKGRGPWRLAEDMELQDLLFDTLDLPEDEEIHVFDPHTHYHARVTLRRPAKVRKRKGGKKFGEPSVGALTGLLTEGGHDELWFDGHFAGLKRMGVACVKMDAETRAGDVVRRLYAHYGAKLTGTPRFTFKGYLHGPEEANPLIMPLWEAHHRATNGLDLPIAERMFRYLTVRIGPEPLQDRAANAADETAEAAGA
jgi:hypothetical protein